MKNCVISGLKRVAALLKSRRAINSLLILVLSLNMLLVTSIAWIAMNRITNANKITMGLAVDDTNAEYKAYMYNMTAGQGTDVDGNGNELTLTNLNMNQYDTIFTSQNIFTPAFSKITITRNESMPKSGEVYLTIERQSDVVTEDTVLSSDTSSIIRFSAFVSDGSDRGITDANELFDHINTAERFEQSEIDSGKNLSYSKTFVNISGEEADHTHEKMNSIVLSIEYDEDDWYKVNGKDTLDVYMYITYDIVLIKCYIKDHGGGGISLDENSVIFKNDLKKVSVSYKE